MILFFDTETTGLPLRGRPDSDPDQPHLVQLAASLCENDGRQRAGFSLIIAPDGWTISAEVAAIHGIDEALARRAGVPEREATEMFLGLVSRATLLVAHNLAFDRRIMGFAVLRYRSHAAADRFKATPGFCTMERARAVCAIPPTQRQLAAGFTAFKNPSLGEAYKHLIGEPLPDGWHDAQVDMRACQAIYGRLTQDQAA